MCVIPGPAIAALSDRLPPPSLPSPTGYLRHRCPLRPATSGLADEASSPPSLPGRATSAHRRGGFLFAIAPRSCYLRPSQTRLLPAFSAVLPQTCYLLAALTFPFSRPSYVRPCEDSSSGFDCTLRCAFLHP
ncbi:hypothetical protein Taro_056105, partial [Colocasia esculenta]|nr:hypothetical protein [Colocasia esculenta]